MSSLVTRNLGFVGLMAIVATLGIGSPAWAGVTQHSPELPPLNGVYRSADDVHVQFTPSALEIICEAPLLEPLFVEARWSPNGVDEYELFYSRFLGPAIVTSADHGLDHVPFHLELQGWIETVTFNRVGNIEGMFDTEIVSMDLSGDVGDIPISIRESPIKNSSGQTTITDIGGGKWDVDSFFDVFAEVKFNGSYWIAADDSARATLIPEPTSYIIWSLLAAVCVSVGWWRRKRAA